eukprot:Opistho-2@86628
MEVKMLVTYFLVLFCHYTVQAQLELPLIFSDNMVLQQNMEIPVWGKSCKNCEVTVTFDNISREIKADKKGDWQLKIPAHTAGGPFLLSISDKKQAKTLQNILVGEVWLCAGQSNMELRLEQSKEAKQEISQASNSQIRFFRMTAQDKARPTAKVVFDDSLLADLQAGKFYEPSTWQVCTTENAAKFSAEGYYFGKLLQQQLNVPIGLICNAVGGTTTQAYIDSASLASHPQLRQFVDANWLESTQDIHPWVLERSNENLAKTKNDVVPNRKFLHPFAGAFLYKNGIQPLLPFAIKGVIWYQGESNATHPEIHTPLFETLVKNWRNAWGQGDFPFYTVQLPAIANRSAWPAFRASQEELSKRIVNSGMVVTIDTGDSLDVHPTDKKTVGERLGLLALAKTYHQKNAYSGPVLRTYEQKGQEVHLYFDHVQELKTKDGQVPKSFVLQGYNLGGTEESMFYPEKIEIQPTKIILTLPANRQVTQIKYAWLPNPKCNIINEVGLPTSPFKFDLKGSF